MSSFGIGRPSLIKPEHIPMVSDKFLILNKQLRLIDPIGQGSNTLIHTVSIYSILLLQEALGWCIKLTSLTIVP